MRWPRIPLWRDVRFWRIVLQGAVVVAVAIAIAVLWHNLSINLQQLNVQRGFSFLNSQASFPIGETPIAYKPSDTYSRALLVGLVNFLRAVVAGIPLATAIGVTIGIARLSSNWLVRHLALFYVETLRNLPLLLQLLFWYAALTISLPKIEARIEFPGPIYLSKQGIVFPWVVPTAATLPWILLLSLGLIAALWIWRWQSRDGLSRSRTGQSLLLSLGTLAAVAAIAALVTGSAPGQWNPPQIDDTLYVQGGISLSPEFLALLLGLALYTAAFIAEIVRAGIQSVAKGQREAAAALGLKPDQTLRLVIFPQALRVIVPPLTNQYLNLSKNSSLAIAVGYPDFYSIASTTASQKSQTIEIVLLIMAAYLSLSLVIAALMNLANRALQQR